MRLIRLLLSGWLNPWILFVLIPALVLVIMWINVETQPLAFAP